MVEKTVGRCGMFVAMVAAALRSAVNEVSSARHGKRALDPTWRTGGFFDGTPPTRPTQSMAHVGPCAGGEAGKTLLRDRFSGRSVNRLRGKDDLAPNSGSVELEGDVRGQFGLGHLLNHLRAKADARGPSHRGTAALLPDEADGTGGARGATVARDLDETIRTRKRPVFHCIGHQLMKRHRKGIGLTR